MQTQSSELNFKGQNLYIGIDVHSKSWTVSILSDKLSHKTFSQPPSAEKLFNYLVHNYPGAAYHSVYEAGFSGYSTHFNLKGMGINNIVINAADVPTSQKEHLLKDDPTDSRKLARSLRSGDLKAIYIPDPSTLQDRNLVRLRATLVKDMTRFKARIKSHLYFNGISYPPEFDKSGSHWSRRFMRWLREGIPQEFETGKIALQLLVEEADQQRVLLLKTTKQVQLLSKSEKYSTNMRLLRTIPGIGLITAITFLTEIENIERFKNTDHFAGFIGLIPNRHASGSKEGKGEMTFRGQAHLRMSLIESAWIAMRYDPALSMCYYNSSNRMESNKAIIKIARKLLNRIYFVLKNQKEYVSGIVK